MLTTPRLVMVLGLPQALANAFDLTFGRGDTSFELLLKSMQGVDGIGKPHGIDRTIRVTIVIRHHFKYPCPTKAFERFGVKMLIAALGEVQRIAHHLAHLLRKTTQLIVRRTHPEKRFGLRRSGHG